MSTRERSIPVLEIGGTHVTVALVAPGSRPTVAVRYRADLRADATAATIVDALADAATRLGVGDSRDWGVAIPGPFDYEAGIGRFEAVGKFDQLNGFDLGTALRTAIHPHPRTVAFVNDADAFGIGECVGGAGRGQDRVVCLTLGTGVGSAFMASGSVVKRGSWVPPDGSAHLLDWNGAPLEETVSRRAIRRRYLELGGDHLDVRGIAARARAGDPRARAVIDAAMGALGGAIAPWVDSFLAEVVVVGGAIARSWDVVEPPLRAGMGAARPGLASIPIRPAELTDDAPLIGAAVAASAHGRFIHRLD